jgi:hypothetical protein
MNSEHKRFCLAEAGQCVCLLPPGHEKGHGARPHTCWETGRCKGQWFGRQGFTSFEVVVWPAEDFFSLLWAPAPEPPAGGFLPTIPATRVELGFGADGSGRIRFTNPDGTVLELEQPELDDVTGDPHDEGTSYCTSLPGHARGELGCR